MWVAADGSFVLQIALGTGQSELCVLLVKLLPLVYNQFLIAVCRSHWPFQDLFLKPLDQLLEAVLSGTMIHVVGLVPAVLTAQGTVIRLVMLGCPQISRMLSTVDVHPDL